MDSWPVERRGEMEEEERGREREEGGGSMCTHTYRRTGYSAQCSRQEREGREEEEKGRKKKDKSLNSVEAEHIISEGCVSSI